MKRGLLGRAAKTQDGRRYQMNAFVEHFGSKRIDQISVPEVTAWWGAFVVAGGRDIRTGKSHLDALSLLFRHTAKSNPKLRNPVPDARGQILGDLQKTASFRARDEANKKPLEVEELRSLLPGLERFGNFDLLLTIMLQYECGLRLGEALGVQWGDCWYGSDENDTGRHIQIERSRIGSRIGLTKSGRSRQVAMSRRLREILLRRNLAMDRPPKTAFVIEQSWPKNIREKLDRVYKAAGVERHKLKDFRDSYASILVQHGIVLKWISLQLGHANVGITERHYARWMAQDGYRNPWLVPEGQLPTDLFATLDSWRATKTPLHATRSASSLK